jgi:hypothetical protein
MSNRKPLIKLEKSDLWQQAQKVSVQIHELVENLPTDEKISADVRLLGTAFNLNCDIAEAVGAIDHRSREYSYGSARKALFSLKSSYRYFGVQQVIALDPDFMVLLDRMIAEIDTQIEKSWHEIDSLEKESKK